MKRMSTINKAESCCCNLPFAGWKACWCILAWIGVCVGLHCIPLPMQKFRLEHTNAVLNSTLPMVNKMIAAQLPASMGSCESTDSVPKPCQEKGPLYHAMQGKNRISILYVTGLDTLSLTKLELHVDAVKKEQHVPSLSVNRDAVRKDYAELVGNKARGHPATDEQLSSPHSDSEHSEDPVWQDGHAPSWNHERGRVGNLYEEPALGRTLRSAAVFADRSLKDVEAMRAKLAALKAKEASMQKELDGAERPTVPPTTTIVKTEVATTTVAHAVHHLQLLSHATTTTPVPALGPATTPVPAQPTTTAAAKSTTTKIQHGSQQYKVVVSGEFRHMGLYLKVEMCDDERGAVCKKTIVATNTSCCDDHRSFHIEISFKCDRDGNPIVHVSDFQLGSLVINAHASLLQKTQQHLVVALPSQDITGKVKETVKSKLTHFLTNKKLVKWGSKQLDFQQLLGRVLKFSAHDDLFRC